MLKKHLSEVGYGPNGSGGTALWWARRYGHGEIAALLLRHEAN
jgi:hypothetical protein